MTTLLFIAAALTAQPCNAQQSWKPDGTMVLRAHGCDIRIDRPQRITNETRLAWILRRK